MYEYNAVILRVVDGDTVDVNADLGFDVHFNIRLRLSGINAPEISTQEGKDTTAYVRSVLPLGAKVVIKTTKDRKDKYGRYLAEIVFPETGEVLNQILLQKGLAVTY